MCFLQNLENEEISWKKFFLQGMFFEHNAITTLIYRKMLLSTAVTVYKIIYFLKQWIFSIWLFNHVLLLPCFDIIIHYYVIIHCLPQPWWFTSNLCYLTLQPINIIILVDWCDSLWCCPKIKQRLQYDSITLIDWQFFLQYQFHHCISIVGFSFGLLLWFLITFDIFLWKGSDGKSCPIKKSWLNKGIMQKQKDPLMLMLSVFPLEGWVSSPL